MIYSKQYQERLRTEISLLQQKKELIDEQISQNSITEEFKTKLNELDSKLATL